MSVELSNEEISRYSRHLILPEVGMAGQKKLKGTSVLCIGTGGWGRRSPCIWQPPVLARLASLILMWLIIPTSNAKSFTAPLM